MITTIFIIVITILVVLVILLSVVVSTLYKTVGELTQKMYQQFKLNEFIVNKLEDLDASHSVMYWGPRGEA